MSGSYAGDRRASADSRPEGIRRLLQSGAAASGDRATTAGANGVTAWGAEGWEGAGDPGIERAAPRLLLGGHLGRCCPEKAADGRGSQHTSICSICQAICALTYRCALWLARWRPVDCRE